MKLFDRIDAWTFRPVDAFVLWAWNELGVAFQTIVGCSCLISYTALMAQFSQYGHRYGVGFWVAAGVLGFLNLTFMLIVYRTPAEALALRNLMFRSLGFARMIRLMWVVLALTSLPISGRDSAVQIIQLAASVIGYAAVPTKPRNKKRREVLFGKLAPARS